MVSVAASETTYSISRYLISVKVARHYVILVLGDLNAKVGKETAYRAMVGCHGFHDECNDNGQRLLDLAIGCNLVIKSTCLPRKDVHKATWLSPDGTTSNQIDHILIKNRHASDVVDIRSCRGANIH